MVNLIHILRDFSNIIDVFDSSKSHYFTIIKKYFFFILCRGCKPLHDSCFNLCFPLRETYLPFIRVFGKAFAHAKYEIKA
jgi:hypothetical protein